MNFINKYNDCVDIINLITVSVIDQYSVDKNTN